MKASRLRSLPPYLFEELENQHRRAVAENRDVIDVSIGDPDLPPPASLLDNLPKAMERSIHHRYPPQRGTATLKSAVRKYLSRRCGVEPADDEILILVGSKEGIAHLPWAVCDPDDHVVLPDPGYPVYFSASLFAGCNIATLPLKGDAGFLPRIENFPRTSKPAKLCFLNYPNNPTSASATDGLFDEVLAWGAEHGTVIANDAAYADVFLDGKPPPLLCGVPGALKKPTIEFFSFSKTFSITGWRVGFAVGNRDVIEALAHLKANIDSGVWGSIQEAVANTLESDGDQYIADMQKQYSARRDSVVGMLGKHGFQCHPSCATFYVWTKVPDAWKSMDFVMHLLDQANVLTTPGIGFGNGGEGYFRIALTQSQEKLEEAVHRISKL